MKRSVLIASLFFIATAISAQPWVDIRKKAEAYYDAAKLDSCALMMEQGLYLLEKEKGQQDSLYVSDLSNYAYLLSQIGEYDKTISAYNKLIGLQRKSKNTSGAALAISLNSFGLFYLDEGEYEKAESLFLEARDLLTEIQIKQESFYVVVINNLGMAYKYMGQYNKAEQLFIEANTIKLRIAGEESKTYATGLNNLASLYHEMGKYAKSEAIYLQAAAITKKLSGTVSAAYAMSMDNLSMLYSSMGQYQKAEEFCRTALDTRKKLFGENNIDYGRSLNNMGGIYMDMSRYKQAEQYFLEGAAIWEKLLGKDHPQYAVCLSNLGNLYHETGSYEESEKFINRVIHIRQQTLGEDHPDYVLAIHNLATLYDDMGQYGKAEALYLDVLNKFHKIVGETHPHYITTLNNLASLYKILGQYEKAEQLYIKATALRKSILGEEHPDYATSLNNLADFYDSQLQYKKAEELYLQAIKIRKKVLGEDHQDYATSLDNLATVYTATGEFKKAEELHLYAISLVKRNFGEENTDYARLLHNLAYLYEKINEDKKAEEYYVQSCAIKKKILGESNPVYGTTLNNLALLYEKNNQHHKAEPLLIKSNTIEKEVLQNTFTSLSEKEKLAYLSTNELKADALNSFLFHNKNSSPDYIRAVINSLLFYKSLTLSDSKSVMDLVRNTKDTVLIRLAAEWKAGRTFLSHQYSLPLALRSADLKKIEEETETAEKKMSLRSRSFNLQQKSISITLTDVQKALPRDEASVEFVRFREYVNGWSDTIIYAAYVQKSNEPIPFFVPLCNEKQLQQLFDSAGTAANAMVSKFYRGLDLGKTGTAASLGKDLYNLVWAPLEPYLKGIKTISYSPAGKLYSIAFHALPVDSNTLLMDKYRLNQYTSTRQVALRNEQKPETQIQSIALFGDAAFSPDSIAIAKSKKDNFTVSRSYSFENGGGSWTDLPGTAEEVKKIKQLFEKNRISTKAFTQTAASEENLKALSGNSPQILHIATHGFFLPQPDKKRKDNFSSNDNSYTLADDPLLRSGLILSGGNYAWSGKSPVNGSEDGIATAYEISQLNLSNTELVVLSACETALGDVKGSEGVFGLQRAFKVAGVKKMIVSLWQVPDKETAELMTSFYNNWLKGKTIEQAFTQAQADMRKKYSPYYWAAFVLVE